MSRAFRLEKPASERGEPGTVHRSSKGLNARPGASLFEHKNGAGFCVRLDQTAEPVVGVIGQSVEPRLLPDPPKISDIDWLIDIQPEPSVTLLNAWWEIVGLRHFSTCCLDRRLCPKTPIARGGGRNRGRVIFTGKRLFLF